MSQPAQVTIVEVGPRDGLQNERRVLEPSQRASFIGKLMGAGLRRVEVASFVDARRVPQMGGAEEVLRLLGPHPSDVSFIGLVLNQRGAHRAVAVAELDEVNLVIPVTDGFGGANQGTTTAAALAGASRIKELSVLAGKAFSVTLAVAFGCPYDGEVSLDHVTRIADAVHATGPVELALADTIGCAVPDQVERTLAVVMQHTDVPLRVHFHETRRTGLANVQAALNCGVRIIDSSVAGIGGCPFAPGAAGNVATEDLTWMLHRSGYVTGVDVGRATATGLDICQELRVPSRSGLSAAGPFPMIARQPS